MKWGVGPISFVHFPIKKVNAVVPFQGMSMEGSASMKMSELICYLLHLGACGSGIAWVKRMAKERPELTPEDHWGAGTAPAYMMWLAVSAGIPAVDLREGVIAALKHTVDWKLTTSRLLSMSEYEVAARWPGSFGHRRIVRTVQQIERDDDWDDLGAYELDLPVDILAAHWPWESIEAGLRTKLSDDDWYQFRSAMLLYVEVRSLGHLPDNEYYVYIGDVVAELSYSEVLRVAFHLNPYLSAGELRELVKDDIDGCPEMKKSEREEGQRLLAAQDALGWEGPLRNDALCEYLQLHSAASKFEFKRAVTKAWQRKMKLETEKENEHGDEH